MKIVTSLYGNQYVSLLLVFLESIQKNVKTKPLEIYVFWSDVEEEILNPIKVSYSNTVFIQLNSTRNIDNSSRGNYFSSLKSGKMAYLNKIYDYLEEGEEFVLMDCDTLVLDDISEVFDQMFDFAFTSIPKGISHYPVNVGVMFFRNNELTRQLTRNMQQHIAEIVKDEELHNHSFLKYGAADQAALCRIIDYESDHKIDNELKLNALKTVELDWFKYNNFLAVENLEGISILHLKGSWQNILFRARPLQSIKNKKAKALKIYVLYLNTLREAVARTYSPEKARKYERKLGVKMPFFFIKKREGLKVCQWKYHFYPFPERFYRYFFNRKLTLLSKIFERILFKRLY
jgi:lipopolysaccharide biosynthesis glycosyltransferase